MTYTAEEIEKLLAAGALMRIGMGSRRACYRLPGGKLCIKCYRSDEEIAEGKHPGAACNKPLAAGAVREIRRFRFDEKHNICAQEYRYWLSLKKRLPEDLMRAFPATMELVKLPTRGWATIEELVENSDGTPPQKFADEWRAADEGRRKALLAAFDSIAEAFVRNTVRMFDPQNILVQRMDGGGGFRLRITDFEPGSRMLVRIDVVPAITRMKVKRRFARYRKIFGTYERKAR